MMRSAAVVEPDGPWARYHHDETSEEAMPQIAGRECERLERQCCPA
jgi:hypothetical protein